MIKRCGRVLVALVISAVCAGSLTVFSQGLAITGAHQSRARTERLEKLVEANIIATHAYQVLLAKKAGKVDAACYSAGKLSETELQMLVAHQAQLLAADRSAIKAWVNGEKSTFDPSTDLEPILASSLTVPSNAPVNIFTAYLRRNTKASALEARSGASLYQTVLEVERDGDRLQEEFAFYIALGLPVYVGQLKLPGSDEDFLEVGRQLETKTCASPFETDAAAWQIAGRKIWNWGEKNSHIRDEKVLATELLREGDVQALVPKIRSMPAQRIAVIGHSFTMGLHWSSPSSFVPVVMEIFKRENPRVEFRQFAAGGLTSSRAYNRFFQDALLWKPDQVFLVVMNRKEEDFEALRRLGEGFTKAGSKVYMFDDVHVPLASNPEQIKRGVEVARASGIFVVGVSKIIAAAPDRASFLALDRIHMKEPYHRLMVKEWLKFLIGEHVAHVNHGYPPASCRWYFNFYLSACGAAQRDTTGFTPVEHQLLPIKLGAAQRDTTGFTPVVRQLLPITLGSGPKIPPALRRWRVNFCLISCATPDMTGSCRWKRAYLVDVRLKLKHHRHEAGGMCA